MQRAGRQVVASPDFARLPIGPGEGLRWFCLAEMM
jgi:hypothetical protein